MIQNTMPGFGQPGQQQGKTAGAPGLNKLTQMEKVVMIDDNTCCEKCKQHLPWAPCCRVSCCPYRYRIVNMEKGYEVGEQRLYTLTETKCCCPSQFTLTDNQGQAVSVYSKLCCIPCFSCCCGGPGFDVHDFAPGGEGTHHGRARYPACQLCNAGYDIQDASEKNLFFVGNVCRCCSKGMDFHPVWNDDKSELVTMNVHVRPCLKKYFPFPFCCLKDHWVMDFPTHANGPVRSEFIAGTLLKEGK